MAEQETNVAKSSGNGKIILFAAVGAVLLSALVGGGVFYFMNSKGDHKADRKSKSAPVAQVEEEEEEEAGFNRPAFYFSLAPAFVVNFQSKEKQVRFLKVELDGVTRHETALEEIKTHMPMIRNSLVMLFSKQVYEDLLDPEGKEELRKDARNVVQKVLKKETGKKGVEDIFFTSFVMQ
jgi:flagellar FliL protein